MTFSREPVAKLDRRRELAQQIVDRHSEEECARVWANYTRGLSCRGEGYLKLRQSLPLVMAGLLEPGELERMIQEAEACDKDWPTDLLSSSQS